MHKLMFVCQALLPKNTEILKGRGNSRLRHSDGMGVMHFGISEGKGGLKHGSRLWLVMDIFLELPIFHFCCFIIPNLVLLLDY